MGFLDRWLVALSLLAGCSFAPQLDGIYACAADDSCPPELHCNVDRRCVGAFSIADLSSIELAYGDLSSIDQARIDLAGLDLSTVDRAMIDLSHVDLSHVDLSQVANPDLGCIKQICAVGQCGEPPDGCGGKLSCGGCSHKLVCGATLPNVCGKAP